MKIISFAFNNRAETYMNVYRLILYVFVLFIFTQISLLGQSCDGDTDPPIIVEVPKDAAVSCGAANILGMLTTWYTNHANMVAEDGQSDSILYFAIPTLEMTIDQFNGSLFCGNTRSVTVSFYAADTCGNFSDTLQARFYTFDNRGPVIVKQAESRAFACQTGIRDTLKNWINAHGNSIATDDCSSVSWFRFAFQDNMGNSGVGMIGRDTIPIPNGICDWKVDVSFIVRDGCNNQSVTTSSFSIIDTIKPFLSEYPQDITVACEDLPLLNQVAGQDNCTSNPLLQYIEEIDRQGNENDCEFYHYTITRTWIVTDNCGNSDSHSQIVTVVDTTPPSISLMDTVTLSCDEVDNNEVNAMLFSVADGCSQVITIVEDSIVGEGCSYDIIRTYTAMDVCGNTSVVVQIIKVIDTEPPSVSVPDQQYEIICDDPSIIPLHEWLESLGGASFNDNCNDVFGFAALSGSYDPSDPLTFPGLIPDSVYQFICPSEEPAILFRLNVDFVFYDDCNNATIIPASYTIISNEVFEIDSCPNDVLLEAIPGTCEAFFTFPEYNYTLGCSLSDSLIGLQAETVLEQNDPNSNDLKIGKGLLDFGTFNPFQLLNVDEGILNFQVEGLHTGNDQNFFYVLTPSGDTLGTSPVFEGECSDFEFVLEFDSDLLTKWLVRSSLFLIIEPNQPADTSVNILDICGQTSVKAQLSFRNESSSSITRTFNINGIAVREEFMVGGIMLTTGIHHIEDISTDCAGNVSICQYTVTILDTEKPEIICMDDISVFLPPDSCAAEVIIPLTELIINDNCLLNKVYNRQMPQTNQASFLNFIEDEDTGDFSVNSVVLTFDEVFPIIHTDKGATLSVEIVADIGSPGKVFQIRGEDGTLIGTLGNTGVEDCSLYREIFHITSEQVNAWGIDSSIIISFIAVDNSINPCTPISQNGSDGISYLRARLTYSDAELEYSISGNTTVGWTSVPHASEQLSLLLNGGENVVSFIVRDNGDNSDTCSVNIQVIDTILPVAICKPAVIFLEASGAEPYILKPEEINNGSYDFCGIATLEVSPNEFTCASLDEEVMVILTVTDDAGNSSTCETTVLVRTRVLNPFHELGICDADTLRLFSNLPPPTVPDAYSFRWTGPNNFISLLENPMIPGVGPENNGTYMLEVTGFNGCVSTGTVEVNIDQLTTPMISSNRDEICRGESILLNAEGQGGQVTYFWYEGVFPNGLLLESSTSPSFLIQPTSGQHIYYLIVERSGCLSNPSPSKMITVVEPPVASVIDQFISVCEGGSIVLGTNVSGSGLTYQWSGPSQFSSNKQFPDTIKNVATRHQGIYSLIISRGTCISDTAFLQVNVFSKPIKPIIEASDVVCEGASITLSVNNIPNGDLYSWFKDGQFRSTTSVNFLSINNVNVNNAGGVWSVKVTEGICESNLSDGKTINVEREISINATNTGPVCIDDSIQLEASFIPGAKYNWSGPNGFSSQLQNPATTAVAGLYFVTVTTLSGCVGEGSTSVQVNEPPEITALSSNAPSCSDGTSTVTFFPSIFPSGSYTYTWSGPNNFTADILNPVIVNSGSNINGVYTLTVSSGICTSLPKSVVVQIEEIPPSPTITGVLNYCVDDDILLRVEPVEDATSYVWNTPQGVRFTQTAFLAIPFAEREDAGTYSVAVEKGDCRSRDSESVEVSVGFLPFPPSIASNEPLCPGEELRLLASSFTNATYRWTGPDGFTSTLQNPIIGNVTASNRGEYQVTVISGGCMITSESIFVDIVEGVTTPKAEQEEYKLCLDNNGTSLIICLEETIDVGRLELYRSSDQMLISSSQSSCIIINDLSLLEKGTNRVFLRVDDGLCASIPSPEFSIILEDIPIVDAEAEVNPIFICDDNPVTVVSLIKTPEVIIKWDIVDPYLDIDALSGNFTNVSGIRVGVNRIALTYSTDLCRDFSTDTVAIIRGELPDAADDFYELEMIEDVLLTVFENDFIPENSQISIISEPSFGKVELTSEGILYMPDPRFSGTITFTYSVCSPLCEDICSEATVEVVVGDVEECMTPTLFTPNGDGYNDYFAIPCLASGQYPGNRLTVFNQWGQIVFEKVNYENDWQGTHNGKDLPVGTYYYILNLGTGFGNIGGFLILER